MHNHANDSQKGEGVKACSPIHVRVDGERTHRFVANNVGVGIEFKANWIILLAGLLVA